MISLTYYDNHLSKYFKTFVVTKAKKDNNFNFDKGDIDKAYHIYDNLTEPSNEN